MAKDEKPFSSAFERLQDLKKRLPKARRPVPAPEARPSAPQPVAPPEPEPVPENPDVDFSQAMKELGIDGAEPGTSRVPSRPPPPAAGRAGRPPKAAPRRVHSGLRGVEDGFDESTPKLDLHGMSVENALAEVQRRVAAWRKAGIPKARIVTGRGSHSGDGQAAIRDAVEAWLRRAPGAVGVYRARPGSGGEGTVLFEQLGKGRKR